MRAWYGALVFFITFRQTKGRCHLEPSSSKLKVRWDLNSQKCIPAVCNGANLLDIPQASGYLPAQSACKVILIDSARARKCLAQKYVLMLGGSTMSETMHDLVMLLSGLASNDEAMKEYMANATRQGSAPHSEIWISIDGQPAPHIEGRILTAITAT
ncbi:g5320 [Coccomyxa elongata]